MPAPELLLDLETTNQGSNPQSVVPTGTGFYFVATMAQLGEELYYSPDGTVGSIGLDNFLDVNEGMPSSHPQSVYTVGERAFFSADDGTEPNAVLNPQRSLYVTDGTRDTTVRFRAPALNFQFSAFGPWGGSGVLFKMSDASTGEELYRTDGTVAGTQMIADINPSGSSQPFGMTKVGSFYVFAATDGAGDRELWRTDGTTATRVVDLNATGSSSPAGFVSRAGKVYFTATISPGMVALYSTDGTTAGTTLVSTASFSSASLGTATSTLVFFVANQDQLWVSDGTQSGTQMVTVLALDSNGDPPTNFRTVGNRVVFYTNTDESDMDLIENIWSSDGTIAGTSVISPSRVVYHHGLMFGSTLYFTENGGSIKRTDGTVAGTESVYTQPTLNPGLFADVHGTLFLSASDPARGNELWTLGTSIGPPTIFADVNEASGNSDPGGFTALGAKTVFYASTAANGDEPYITDGTAAGTSLLADINPGAGSSLPRNFVTWNGIGYFTANDVIHGGELWRTDGTSAGTYLVTDIDPGAYNGGAVPYAGPNALYLYAHDSDHGYELWRSDGTAAGTALVYDINPGPGYSWPGPFATLGSTVIFAATTDTDGRELWISDGTTGGTHMVTDVCPGAGSGDVWALPVPMGAYVYVVANDGVHGKELFRTDGTAAGTTRITDINAGAGDTTNGNMVVMGSWLYFDASDGTRQEMWKTNGVTTTMITGAINPSGSNATPGVAVGSTLYFTASDATHGTELWATDGTVAGVRLVADINPAANAGSSVAEMTALGGKVYFSANDGTNGSELWSSDGTASGTVAHSGLGGDPSSSNPRYLATSNGKLYLQMTDVTHGAEPFTLTP